MNELVLLRHMFLSYYKKHQDVIIYITKFVCAFFLFIRLSTLSMGNMHLGMAVLLSVIFSLIATLGSSFVFFLLVMFATAVFLFFASIELSLLAVIGIFLILVFYIRIFPVESLIIPAMLTAYYFKIPYAVPLVAGFYFGITSIIPVVCSVFLWYLLPHLKEFAALAPWADFSPSALPDTIMKIYVSFTEFLTQDREWFFVAVLYALVILVTYICSKLTFNYAKELSFVLGAFINCFGFIMLTLIGKVNTFLPGMFLGTVIGLLIAEIIRFFDIVVDYPKTERVEFEDETNYYYVKIIPKVLSEDFQPTHKKTRHGKRSSRPEHRHDYQSDYRE